MKIENPFLSVEVSSHGGELCSIKLFRQEILYQKDGSWGCQDHVLFPIVGPAKSYTCYGKSLSTSQHGFVRNSDLYAEQISPTEMSFSLSSSAETLRVYPYPFSLKQSFRLDDETLVRRIAIKNTGDKPMPFGTGFHPAYIADLEKGSIEFRPGMEYYPFGAEGVADSPIPFDKASVTPLNECLHPGEDTLILKNDGSPIILHTGKGIEVETISNAPLTAIWTPSNKEKFICVEAWWGISKRIHEPEELAERAYEEILQPGESKVFEFRTKFRLI